MGSQNTNNHKMIEFILRVALFLMFVYAMNDYATIGYKTTAVDKAGNVTVNEEPEKEGGIKSFFKGIKSAVTSESNPAAGNSIVTQTGVFCTNFDNSTFISVDKRPGPVAADGSKLQ